MMASDSGKTSAWPRRQPQRQPRQPGAVSPAGWFQPTGGEAAPPFRHGMEPARPDETTERPGYARAPYAQDASWYEDPHPTRVHKVPSAWPWTFQADPRQIPVVGPTEALRGRAGGPGLAAPPGAVPGLLDPERRSCWQLAQQVWQESGVSWEPADQALAGPGTAGTGVAGLGRVMDRQDSAEPAGALAEGGDVPAEYWNEPAEDWNEPVDDWRGPVDDWAEPADDDWDEPADDWVDAGDPEFEAAASGSRPGSADADPNTADGLRESWIEPTGTGAELPGTGTEPPGTGAEPADTRTEPPGTGFAADAAAGAHYETETETDVDRLGGAALNAAGPRTARFPQPPGQQQPVPQLPGPQPVRYAPGPQPLSYAPVPRPVPQAPGRPDAAWQEPASQDVPRPQAGPARPAMPTGQAGQAGQIGQAVPARPIGSTGRIRRSGTGWSDYPTNGFPGQFWPTDGTGPMPVQPPSPAAPRSPAAPPAFAAMPLGAPVAEAVLPMRAGATRPLGEPDELFRAWQGSVRQAAAPRRQRPAPWQGTTNRRRRAWRVVTIGVPSAVIVTVGAGALMMLTGRADEMLAVRANTGTQPPAASGAAQGGGNAQGSTSVTGVTLAGYPGQHGAVAADSMWSSAGASLAVGGADGHPAIWRRSGGAWTLVSVAVLGAIGGTGNLTAVAHGPAGWIAVGSTSKGGSGAPLVLASADTRTWQPVAALVTAAGPDVQFFGAAAGPLGYAVVGRQMIGGRSFATLWWSADLRTWVQGGNGGLDGRQTASTANAAAATGTGFVAVGSHGAFASIWTSSDGAHWGLRNVSAPAGARSATLSQVVISGNTIVATGYADTGAGDIPLAVASTDGGAHWREVVLPASHGLGIVTALTTQGTAFIAAGQAGLTRSGQTSAQHAVTWSSPDGLNWSAATPVTGVRQITALSASHGTVTGTAQRGAAPSVVTFPAR